VVTHVVSRVSTLPVIGAAGGGTRPRAPGVSESFTEVEIRTESLTIRVPAAITRAEAAAARARATVSRDADAEPFRVISDEGGELVSG
jgi:hypothetical protein